MKSDIFASSRRGFVKQGLGVGLGLAGSGGTMVPGAMAKALAGYQPIALSRAELAAVRALMARLIPA